MKKLLLFFLIIGTSLFAQEWKPTTGSVKFSLKMLGVSVDGNLGGIAANLTFENNEPSDIYATVKTNTVNTNNSLRDTHLKEKPEYFEPEKFPTITMRSKTISKNGSSFKAVFDVTIKGVTKQVNVPFTFEESGNSGTFKSMFTINRRDWKFGGNTLGMGDTVTINILLNVKKLS